MNGWITLGNTKINLPVESLYWAEDRTLILSSDKLASHILTMDRATGLLNRRGYDVIVCACGTEKEEAYGNGNMYLLFGGFVEFKTLPDGFIANYLIANEYLDTGDCLIPDNSFEADENKPYTILCPSGFNPDMTLTEMQEFFAEKASVLHKWAGGVLDLTWYETPTTKRHRLYSSYDFDNYFFDGKYFEIGKESGYKYSKTFQYNRAISYMEKFFGLPKPRKDKDGKIQNLTLHFDDGSEFDFDDLEAVYYEAPLDNPAEHSIILVNSERTLIANGYDETCVMLSYKFTLDDLRRLTNPNK